MQYTEIFSDGKIEYFPHININILLVFAQIIDCGYLCFGSQIRKIGNPCIPLEFFYIKVGFKGVYISHFPDANFALFPRIFGS